MDEIPYEILSEHGLSQEMVDDLPENVIESLLTGGRTPVLPFNIDDKKGKARISLVRTNAGVDVFVMPYFSHINMEGFDEEQQKTLRSGKVLLASFEGKPDMYYQLDETTNQIVSCPKSVIEHNLEILTKQVGVPEESAKQLSTGEVITFTKDQGCVTYSVDLSEERVSRCPRVTAWIKISMKTSFLATPSVSMAAGLTMRTIISLMSTRRIIPMKCRISRVRLHRKINVVLPWADNHIFTYDS